MPAPKKVKTRKVSLPRMIRDIPIVPDSLDKKARTVDVIFTKGARVLRRGFFEDFFEELGLEKDEVLMERLQSGSAPVLDNHGFSNLKRAQTGVVESAELNPGVEGTAKLRFSRRAEVEELFKDIEDGIVRNISVGYNILSFEKVGEEQNLPILRATKWEPIEISTVPAGADPGAQIRNESVQMTDCTITEQEKEKPVEEPVDNVRDAGETKNNKDSLNETVDINPDVSQTRSIGEKTMTPEEKAKLEAQNKKIADEAREAGKVEAKDEEKKRQLEIRSVVSKMGFDKDTADKLSNEYISEDKTIDEVRTLVINKLADKDKKPENRTNPVNVSIGEDLSRKGRVEGMTSAILHRFRPKAEDTVHQGRSMTLPGHELTESGRAYAYFSLVDMARACLEAQRINTGMLPKHSIADTALNNTRSLHSISDFPEILANVANKTLRGGYLAAPQTFQAFTTEVFVSDFKEIARTNLGDAPKLEKLEEGSEVKRGSISEAAEKYRVEEFAKIIAISRKVIINDDLGAFTKIPERMGRRAADLESDTVWDIVKANAALADTFALYSAPHGNLSTVPAAPSETGLSEGRKLMRRQVGLDGAEISLTPVWIYVPPEHETVAEKLIASIVPDSSTNVSPFSSVGRTPLRLDVEPRLETGSGGSLTAWFMMADKGQVDMIELAKLEGTDGPQIQTRDGFDVNGMEIKIMHDIGAKAIDFRGLFKNAGA